MQATSFVLQLRKGWTSTTFSRLFSLEKKLNCSNKQLVTEESLLSKAERLTAVHSEGEKPFYMGAKKGVRFSSAVPPSSNFIMIQSNKLYEVKYFKTLTTVVGSIESAVIIINCTTFIWFLFTSSHFSHPNKCVCSKSSNSEVNLGVLRNAVIISFLERILASLGIFCSCLLQRVSLAFQDHKSKYKRDIVSFCNSTGLSFSVTEIFSLADRDQGSECSQRSALFSAR